MMYLGDRAQPKLVVIDEAWDLLTQGDVARFILVLDAQPAITASLEFYHIPTVTLEDAGGVFR